MVAVVTMVSGVRNGDSGRVSFMMYAGAGSAGIPFVDFIAGISAGDMVSVS
jgi:hypothetical protein